MKCDKKKEISYLNQINNNFKVMMLKVQIHFFKIKKMHKVLLREIN
jgi:hypothetical protein